MRTRSIVLRLFAVVCMIIAGSIGAHAASAATNSGPNSGPNQPRPHSTVTSKADARGASPAIDVSCAIEADVPFKLTPTSAIYGQGKIDSCTPGAGACQRIVELQQWADGNWETVASNDDGWKSCDSHLVTASYKCLSTLNTYDFRTYMSVTLETIQGTYGSNFADSTSNTFPCE